ncbi:toll/interleukin-1 receptor domain-containing protein [Candidatus Symbiobacter mobilis]|uniref:TIR domain-containing protein n=1 Tax=Candidatus Symbiobacter mobilis CR TaxID=946483 RepID=U5N4I7_9BURK|nr:toll/interleukin-1 receptor domain-containing protein [Candidatus Symbiobacter mobilis]AGX86376.1 hypothetical protein Cenrod_0249 [Candidatus Symbiobacter mobilis CR]
MNDLTTFPWDDLLSYIRDRRVIPVIGSGVLMPGDDGLTLSCYLARQLALRLKLEYLPGDDLRSVAGRYVGEGGKPRDLYLRLAALLNENPPPLPPALQQLADITDFPLMVTLGVDPLLADAVRGARGKVDVRAFKPRWRNKQEHDLPLPIESLSLPTVYHLLGKSSNTADHVVTDEDLLEFLNALHGETQRPEHLFGALAEQHLLILGVDLPDWAMRLLLRLLRGDLLSRRRDSTEYLVMPSTHDTLAEFLSQFGGDITTVSSGTEAFVAELHRRWMETRPPVPQLGEDEAALPDPRTCHGKIFISYASEDRPAVEKLARQLHDSGIDAWFDRDRLESGDLYAHKIQEAIQRCDFFVPVISQHTEARLEGFFRREWRWASERQHAQHHSRAFLLPVVIDNTQPYGARVEESFNATQWTSAPDGVVDEAFVTRLRSLVRELRRGVR